MISTKHYRTLLIGLSAGMLAAALPYMDARAGLPEQLTSNNFGIHQVGTSKVVMDRDGNHVEFQILRPFNGDFRVFGITFNQLPHSAIGYIDAFMPMVELALDKKVWQESAATDDKRCEAQAVKRKKVISVIFANADIKRKMEEYRNKPAEGRFAMHIEGYILKKTRHTYDGKPPGLPNTSGEFNFFGAVIVTKADIIPAT